MYICIAYIYIYININIYIYIFIYIYIYIIPPSPLEAFLCSSQLRLRPCDLRAEGVQEEVVMLTMNLVCSKRVYIGNHPLKFTTARPSDPQLDALPMTPSPQPQP